MEETTTVQDISPGFAVAKADGKSVRLVVNHRMLNNFIQKDAYPIMHFDILLKYIGDKNPKIISCLDISSAYYSLRCSEETKKFLGVAIDQKIYQMNVLPQGGKNSAQIFTRHMEKILSAHPQFKENIFLYIDDLFVISEGYQEHLETLKLLFQILKEAGIKLNLQKSNFSSQETLILGHVFTASKDGFQISVKKKRIDAITKIDKPRNKKQLRHFLGSCNFLARNLPDYRKKASKLYKLTGSKVKFEFTKEHEKIFEDIKELVKSPAVIYLPKLDAKKRLVTDSSEMGYGAVLYDVIENADGTESEYPIGYDTKSYGSKKFQSSTHFEIFGFVSAILSFKYLLHGHEFELVTDSSASAQLMKGRKSLQGNDVILRLLDKVKAFSFFVTHEKANQSKRIQVADALSRLPIKEEFQENPMTVYPIAYPSKFLECMPGDQEEIVLLADEEQKCLYNLRKSRRPPARYRQSSSESSDSESETEETQKKSHKI